MTLTNDECRDIYNAAMEQPDRRAAAALHRVRVHLANQYYYSHREFCEKLAEIIASSAGSWGMPL